MKKTAQQICDFYSPNRFDKTAGSVGEFFKNTGRKIKKYYNMLPKLPDALRTSAESGSFGSNFMGGIKSYLNPKNYVHAFKYGPTSFIDDLANSTFSSKAWKDNTLSTALGTAGNLWAATSSIAPFIYDDPSYDEEGTLQKVTRQAMNAADLADLGNKIMMRKAPGVGGFLGMMTTRIGAPILASKLDNLLGTNVTKEQLRDRFTKRVIDKSRELIDRNPGLNQIQAQQQAISRLIAENPEYLRKLL